MTARSSRPPLDRSKQRYALLVDSLDDEHEQSVVHGTLAAAREVDARLLVVAGGPIDAPDTRLAVSNFAFDLVGSDNSLGILVLSSALGNACGPERLGSWLERYPGVPMCCMGVPIPGRVSVRVDNGDGIRQAVTHLIREHKKQHIGFIRGPAQSDEAEVRLAAYRETLQQHGLTADPRMIADGDYNRPSGVQAIRTIFDQRRVSLHAVDAFAAANDYMALGAMEELGRRGVNVPDQIAVVGFDDVPSATASRPALTTVRQPGTELGREGLKQLLLLAGGAVNVSDRVLSVDLRVRRSCGCTSLELGLANRNQGPIMTGSFEAALIQKRQLIVAELARAAQGTFGAAGSDWESALLSALLEEMRDSKAGALSRRVQRLLLKLEQGGGDLAAAPHVLSTLRRQALPCVASSPEARDRMEDAISDAQIVATTMLTQAAVAATRVAMTRARGLGRDLQERMFGDAAAISRALADHLPGLGVEACVVATLAPGRDDDWLGDLRFGFGPGRDHVAQETVSLARLALHPLLEASRTLFMLPIVLGAEPLGVAAFSVTTQLARSDLLEDLRELLGPVLKVTRTRHG